MFTVQKWSVEIFKATPPGADCIKGMKNLVAFVTFESSTIAQAEYGVLRSIKVDGKLLYSHGVPNDTIDAGGILEG
jgi:hypothetical protein